MSLQTLLSVQNTDIEQSWLLTPPASLSPVSSPYLSLSPARSLLTGDSNQVTWTFTLQILKLNQVRWLMCAIPVLWRLRKKIGSSRPAWTT